MRTTLRKSWVVALVPALLLGEPTTAAADTFDAAGCSHAEVAAAVEAASWGDTVVVPACEADWGEGTLVVTKGIELRGAGAGLTVIGSSLTTYSTSHYLVSFEADETTATTDTGFVLDGFTLEAHGTVPPYGLLRLSNDHPSSHLTKVVVSNNVFRQLVDSGSTCFAIALFPAVFGVTYHNEIIDGDHAWRFLGSLDSGKTVVHWEPGSPYAMYFEDNDVRLSEPWSSTMIISGGGGNRYVSRYNTFDVSLAGPTEYTQAHDIHGNQPNNPGAGIGFEAYGEKRIGGTGRWLDQRGGQVFFFMNQWSESGGTGSYHVWEEYDDDTFTPTSCEGLEYPTTAGGVNCLQRARDSYYWRNFGGDSGATLSTALTVLFDYFDRSTDPPTVNDPLLLFENQSWWRDTAEPFTGEIDPVGACGYFEGPACTRSGIGCGTLAEMQAITACTEGVGFWVTSQGNCDDLSEYVGHTHGRTIEGTLYRCNGASSWEAIYTPYPYPHPLRAGEGGQGGGGGSGAAGASGGTGGAGGAAPPPGGGAGAVGAGGEDDGCGCRLQPGRSASLAGCSSLALLGLSVARRRAAARRSGAAARSGGRRSPECG